MVLKIVVYFILLGALLGACMAFMTDVVAKHKQEMTAFYLKISECKHRYVLNRCEDPVPEVRAFCI